MPDNKEKKEGYIIQYKRELPSGDKMEFVNLEHFKEITEDNVLVYERKTKSGRKEKGFINLDYVAFYKLYRNA